MKCDLCRKDKALRGDLLCEVCREAINRLLFIRGELTVEQVVERKLLPSTSPNIRGGLKPAKNKKFFTAAVGKEAR